MDSRSRAIAMLRAKRDRQAKDLADYLGPVPEWVLPATYHKTDVGLIHAAYHRLAYDMTRLRAKPYKHARMFVALCDTVKHLTALEQGEDVDTILLHILAAN